MVRMREHGYGSTTYYQSPLTRWQDSPAHRRAALGKPPNFGNQSSIDHLKVDPQITDPAIDNWLDPHFVALHKIVPRRHELLLFLSGSYGRPGRQLLFMKEAVELGYHVINLHYPNSWTVAELCQDCQDRHCHEKVRLDIIDGARRSNKVDVGRANSIENRLVQLLTYLHQQQPANNWRQFLQDGAPRWEAIAVAGHSQGGGHAALIAKSHRVSRVILFSAPADYSPIFKGLAPWLVAPPATPTERYYGFIHIKDPGFVRVKHAWGQLGIAPSNTVTNIDDHAPPYGETRALITAARPARPGKFHGAVVNDLHTPKLGDGNPKFQAVWRYLLTAAAD